VETYSATFATIGKAARYGGDLCVTPRARIDRPEFEICLVDSRSRLRYLRLLSQAMRGGMRGDKRGIRFLHATRAQAFGNTAVQVDGELIGKLPMTFELAPQRLRLSYRKRSWFGLWSLVFVLGKSSKHKAQSPKT